jgi:hypothetical protein
MMATNPIALKGRNSSACQVKRRGLGRTWELYLNDEYSSQICRFQHRF